MEQTARQNLMPFDLVGWACSLGNQYKDTCSTGRITRVDVCPDAVAPKVLKASPCFCNDPNTYLMDVKPCFDFIQCVKG